MIFLFEADVSLLGKTVDEGRIGWEEYGSGEGTPANPLHYSYKNYTIIHPYSGSMSTDRRLWSPEEDQQIIRLVSKYGTKKWPLISEKLCGQTEFERTGKQCRERWYNHLNPEIDNSFWSQQDERRLFEAHKLHGNKWKAISKEFVGRTDNSIKNHFYSTIRRCLRRINKFQGQKNSTLKMRNIKPYVLSKILADRNLTETILEMGKIKPNKSRREYNPEYFRQFNQMIEKLYEINKEYELVKANKKAQNRDSHHSPAEEEEERMDMEAEGEPEQSELSQSVKSEQPKPSPEKADSVSFGRGDNGGESASPRKKNRRPKKRIIANPPTLQHQILLKEHQPLPRQHDTSSRRCRRTINYMKLNQGILCESERPQVDQTNYESDLSKKRLQQANYDPFSLEEQRQDGQQNLEEIEEQEQKSNEKDNMGYIFNQDFVEMKPLGSFNISNPSPSFRTPSHFDELVVIGLKLFPSISHLDHNEADRERKKSEEEFIEEILEINFDPDEAFTFKEEPEEQQEEEQGSKVEIKEEKEEKQGSREVDKRCI